MKATRIAVIGGGIVGLVTAWQLAYDGHEVVVIDEAPGSGATYAAAGMLAPGSEIAPGEDANFALQRDAVSRWNNLSNQVFETCGRRIDVHAVGTLWCGLDSGDRRLVQQQQSLCTVMGVATRSVHRAVEPVIFDGLHPQINDGFLIDDEAWINPDQAVSILLEALRMRGVAFHSGSAITIRNSDANVIVLTSKGTENADSVIICQGANSPIDGSPTQPTVRPVRGMTVRTLGVNRSGLPMVRSYVHGRSFYLVGRDDGYCVIGASSEEKRTAAVEVGELQRLLRDSLEVVPSLETAVMLESRVGLRPATSSGEPFFVHDASGRVASSNGHYRHGVTLAPMAAVWASDFIRGATL